jgi:hypothetical protein
VISYVDKMQQLRRVYRLKRHGVLVVTRIPGWPPSGRRAPPMIYEQRFSAQCADPFTVTF